MLRTLKLRIYPSKTQKQVLEQTLEFCRLLYNNALVERKNAWENEGKSVTCLEQLNRLPEVKRLNPCLTRIQSQVLQDVLRRLDKAFKKFFKGAGYHKKAGYPRFKGLNRYDSFTFPQFNNGVKLLGKKLRLPKIGEVNIKLHHDLPADAKIKTCTIYRDVDQWYACFSIELSSLRKERREIKNVIGIDVGLKNLVVLSNGMKIKNPYWLKRSEEKLAFKQRRRSHKKRSSKNYLKQCLKVARLHRKIRNQRSDFNHKLSRMLVNNFDLIKFENLRIQKLMQHNYLAKSIADASWFQLMKFTRYKAEEAGAVVEFVPAKGTSITCSECGFRVQKTLATREHNCLNCGFIEDRDVNAAKNILLYTVGLTGSACGGVRKSEPMKQEPQNFH